MHTYASCTFTERCVSCTQGSAYHALAQADIGRGEESMHFCTSMSLYLVWKLDSHGVFSMQVPFFVGTTAGTTVLGAFDPFEQIAAICKKHGVWMHVDGCWGAAALLTPEHRHLMKGCELSDSLAWNPHKLMGLPLQCSAFLTTHKGQRCLEGQLSLPKAELGPEETCLIMSDVLLLPVGY